MTEYEIHKAVVKHLRTRGVDDLLFWHTPNDAKRSWGSAARLKAMGMRSGVPDIMAVHGGKIFGLELKAAGKVGTDNQWDFIMSLEEAGGYGCVCDSLDRALAVLKHWGLLK